MNSLVKVTYPAIPFLQGKFQPTRHFIEAIQSIDPDIDLADAIIEVSLIKLKDAEFVKPLLGG